MNLELTVQQQDARDREDQGPRRMIDPRSRAAYVLVPEGEYDAMREFNEGRPARARDPRGGSSQRR